MLAKLIDFSLENRFLVFVAFFLMACAGVWSALQLPIDAVPDMTNVQITVITEAGALSPVEVERFVTYPIESTMGGIPNVAELRSISRFGISVVTIVFNEGTDIYLARQLVNERIVIATSMIPREYGSPELGPLTTALGEILQFELRGAGYSPTELRSVLDWDIIPKLRGVNGVTEVNSHGGLYKTYEIQPDPQRLSSNGVTLAELFAALEANNLTAGGGYVVRNHESQFIRGQAMIHSFDEIRQIALRRDAASNPLLIGDVADVCQSAMTRQGVVTRDGRGEIVTGMVMMLIGENSREVVERAKKRLEEIKPTLPPGMTLEVIYDRADLIRRTLKTVLKNLVEGGALVVLVLLIMLGSFRAGLITALAIPLSMLFATNLMYAGAITASLMSLGAIDFGLIVDSSVIMVENCMHRLAHAVGTNRDSQGNAILSARERTKIIRDAAIEVRKPTMFGELIIAVVYLPILMLEGTEGKLFRPMALTVLFALAGSLLISMTLMPALAATFLPKRVSLADGWFIRACKSVFRPVISLAIRNQLITAILAFGVFAISIPVSLRLGAEFMPRLEEGDLLIEANRLPSASLEDAVAMSTQIENALNEFPEVRTVFCKTGRPEIANDVMGIHQTDVWVILKSHSQWRSGLTRDALLKEMSTKLNGSIPGAVYAFTQPIEMRVDELVAGVKAEVAVLLYGEDLQVLGDKAKEIERILKMIPGAKDVKADYQANLTTVTIVPNRAALAQYGINSRKVMDVVEAIGGRQTGVVYEGRARYPMMVRFPERWRGDIEMLKQLPVDTVNGEPIPLGDLADIRTEETSPGVEHEATRRRTFIACNVRERDVASFVAEAQQRIGTEVQLPAGYEVMWGGDFENLQSASLRLMLITPIVLLLIFLLLFTTFKSFSLAGLIYLSVPIAASGGIFALWIRGMPFSISAGVGFIALFGVAVLNGLVWVSAAEVLRRSGITVHKVAEVTALARLRPILMTALVASLGFIPMALSMGDGAEMQRPLATVVIGGLITSTLLTTVVVPAIYPWFAGHLPTVIGEEAE
jgi:cobalt-zinc-cadmium resistance protein CzcA